MTILYFNNVLEYNYLRKAFIKKIKKKYILQNMFNNRAKCKCPYVTIYGCEV